VCLTGLKLLEYRGYDSAGIGGVSGSEIAFCKRAGKLSNLTSTVDLPTMKLAIAHTRWATHGKVTDQNAHPHLSACNSIALIHNGIIENYAELKEALFLENVPFASETDSEVVVNLIAKYYQGDLVKALHRVLPLLKGIFAFLVIHKDHPDEIVAAARECPLSIGTNDDRTESIVSSDPNAFQGPKFDILFLRGDEIARIKKDRIEVFDSKLKPTSKKTERLEIDSKPPSKEGFEHFMLKEIFEQPATVQKALLGRIENGEVLFDELKLYREQEGLTCHDRARQSAIDSNEEHHSQREKSDEKNRLRKVAAGQNTSSLTERGINLQSIRQLWILGCGTSSHAGLLASILLEDLARLPGAVEIASEARYRNPLLSPETLVVAMSQSGETADTLAALRETKKYGCQTLGICNVKNSALAREADATLFLKAGPEMSVCSTKAFTSQLAVLSLLAVYFGRLKGHLSKEAARHFFQALKKIPSQIQTILDRAGEIQILAKKYAQYDNFFFMGRRYMVPTCMEAALKLKEISYVNANGYPAGELKHGPIALLHPRFPVIAFCANDKTRDKIGSNLAEVKARGAPVFAIAPEDYLELKPIADDVFYVPKTIDELAPFPSTIVGQLFAYYLAKERGCDIDQPRNLAKSVTVE
jgi:glucosamine--fructose-6-phosphate aminotransferase (isomerizing)